MLLMRVLAVTRKVFSEHLLLMRVLSVTWKVLLQYLSDETDKVVLC
jgi:hypothetical protein